MSEIDPQDVYMVSFLLPGNHVQLKVRADMTAEEERAIANNLFPYMERGWALRKALINMDRGARVTYWTPVDADEEEMTLWLERVQAQ